MSRPPLNTWFHVKEGDVVTRMLAGTIPMRLRVTALDDEFIYCGPVGTGWMFTRAEGWEYDPDCHWGPEFGVTGSFLSDDPVEPMEGGS